ncbi:hypothetical protein TNCV_1667881 [Trichonephila clavipes]|nr:hypothetical protein TNCV_1667881 [Trichonephila clavipes]
MPAQVPFTSLDHGSKLRGPSPKALVYLNSATLIFNQSINDAFILKFENIADKLIGYNTLMELTTARCNLHKMRVVESGGLPYNLKLAVGYPYMITMNLDVEDVMD